jgi:hypothetical protein
MLHPWMSKEKIKKSKTKQPKLSNVPPMDDWGENQKGLNEQPKLSSIAPMDEWGENQKRLNGITKIV